MLFKTPTVFLSLGLVALASPSYFKPQQHAFNVQEQIGDVSDMGDSFFNLMSTEAEKGVGRDANPAMVNKTQWTQVTTMNAYPNYQLRIKQPKLCDTNVTQYSGYLDTAEDKHFFFWFFEARNKKREDAPVMLWLNGGPGCSSFTGLLMELGPCRAGKGGNHTEYNPYGWNDQAHVLFLDQPTNVGFSYGKGVFNSIAAGQDVNALLQLFFKSFPEYSNNELHLFGESYGGHYIPAVAKAIHETNSDIKRRQLDEFKPLRLTSIGIGNGMVDVLTQYKYYSKMACNSTYPPVLTQEQCRQMDRAYPICKALIQTCYKWKNALSCVPAKLYCSSRIENVYTKSGRNLYDVRRECVGEMCYEIDEDITKYLNKPEVQKELGVEVSEFESCSPKVMYGFVLNGDQMKPFHQEIPPLLRDGIRVLIYAGDADFICNWYGNKAWSLEMEWEGKEQFNLAKDTEWVFENKQVGEARTHGNFTFVRVFGAGHMVPYDQPEASLDMVNRWLSNKPY